MKKIVLAAMLVATATSADAAVTFSFSGSEDGGAAVSGTLTIDTDALAAALSSLDAPSLEYSYQTDDDASTVKLPFLSFSFASAGNQPVLLSSAAYTYQWLIGDLDGGQFGLELDYTRDNGDGTITNSWVTLSGFDLAATKYYGGVLLPDFAQAGTVYFDIRSGTGENETTDLESTGTLVFDSAGSVPESSTWAMLTLGFGAVGYAMRRRTRVRFAA